MTVESKRESPAVEGHNRVGGGTGEMWVQRGRATDAWASTREAILENDASNAAYPQYVARANGAYLWDVDGKRYIDFVLGYGPVVLGHCRPEVTAAVLAQQAEAVCISPLWSPRQVELTERLVDLLPGAEQAYLLRTGSDATSAAVRLARIATGRTKILKWGYNGWHDWTAPRPAGVPASTLADTVRFQYNDIDSIAEAFAQHPREIACIIMMAYDVEAVADGFLHEVRDLAHREGALFILDEMRSGFRIALGGAQQYFGIEADLATYSKAMANGYVISAVTGRRDVMQGLAQTHMSSTFYANPAEMAAALATIDILEAERVPEHLWTLGRRFQEGLRRVITDSGLPAEVVGYAVAPFLLFDDRDTAVKTAFYSAAVANGVLLHPNHQWYLSAAHTEDDVDMSLAVCAAAAEHTMRAV